MGSFGKCKICGEKIYYSPENVAKLGVHLVEKHPGADLTYFTLTYDNGAAACACDDCKHPGCTTGNNPAAPSGGKREKEFKTTIESWKESQNSQMCPKCGKTSVPLIKRQRHKIAKSSFGAFILLGCWPVCFLPFILGGSDLMYLYCRECGHYIGMHDRREADSSNNGTSGGCACAKA